MASAFGVQIQIGGHMQPLRAEPRNQIRIGRADRIIEPPQRCLAPVGIDA